MTRSMFMRCTSIAPAVRRGLGEHVLHVIAVAAENAHYAADLVAVGGVDRRPQAHGLEHLLHLAARELLAAGQLLAHGLGTVARARQAGIPAQHRVGALAPVVGPAIV